MAKRQKKRQENIQARIQGKKDKRINKGKKPASKKSQKPKVSCFPMYFVSLVPNVAFVTHFSLALIEYTGIFCRGGRALRARNDKQPLDMTLHSIMQSMHSR